MLNSLIQWQRTYSLNETLTQYLYGVAARAGHMMRLDGLVQSGVAQQ